MNTTLLERLQEQHKAATNLLVSDKGDDRLNRARELADLEVRIAAVEAGDPRCRECGSDYIRAHWRDWTSADIVDMCVDEGQVQFEYSDAGRGHSDAGDNDDYECVDCGFTSPSLEYLLGVADREYTREQYIEKHAGLLHQVGTIIQDRRDRAYEGAGKPDDPVWIYIEENLGELYDRFGAIIDSVEEEIFSTQDSE